MKLNVLLATATLVFAFSAAASAQSNEQIKVSINKQNNQLEVLQNSDGKNITSNYTLQRAEMDIFADGDAAGMLEIKNTWTIPVQEFESGEVVQLELVEIIEKSSGAVIKLKSHLQVFPK